MGYPYEKCVLLLPMSGSNNGTVFPDYSPSPKIATRYGATKTVTEQSRYYGSSGYFGGGGDRLTLSGMPSNAYLFSDLSNPFTIEFWVRPTGNNSESKWPVIFTANKSSSYRYTVFMGGVSPYIAFTSYIGSVKQTVSIVLVPLNSWTHIRFVCEGNRVIKAFKNGVFSGSLTATVYLASSDSVTYHIGDGVAFNDPFMGYLQDFRITSSALNTGDFTPPSRLLGSLGGIITDHNGQPCQRKVYAMSRPTDSGSPIILAHGLSDATTGAYELAIPSGIEVTRVVVSEDDDPLLNDLVDRVIPA